MTQDFAKRARSQHGKKAKRKSDVPAWVWLFTGSVLGAFVMFLFYLTGIPPQPGSENVKDVLPTIVESVPDFNNETSNAKANTEEKPREPRFTFYKQLENEEFEVDDKPLNPEQLAQKLNVQYVIQVGSFGSAESADRLRAQLILLNFNTWVDSRDTRSHEHIYSVKVGPFATSAKRDNAKSTLYNNGFDDILVLTQKLARK